MKVFKEKYDGLQGVAVILTEEEYNLWWDYRNRPKSRKLQDIIAKTLRGLYPNNSMRHADKSWLEYVAEQENTTSKYIRGWLVDTTQS